MDAFQLHEYLNDIKLEDIVKSVEYKSTTLYFIGPVELLEGKYPDALHSTISIEFPDGQCEPAYASVMVTPTRKEVDGAMVDYDWVTVDWPDSVIGQLLDQYDPVKGVCCVNGKEVFFGQTGLLHLIWAMDENRLSFFDSDGEYIDYIDTDSMSYEEVADIAENFLERCKKGTRAAAFALMRRFPYILGIVQINNECGLSFPDLKEKYGSEWINRIGNMALILEER